MGARVGLGVALLLWSGCIVERRYEPPPPAGRAVYERCTTTPDCVTGATCYELTYEGATAGLCSVGCAGDADCVTGSTGARGACYDLAGGGTYLCYERCATDGNCASGFSCRATTAGDAICLPGAPAPPPPENYASCASVADCNTLAEDCFFVTFEGLTRGMCSGTCASDADCPAGATLEPGACYDVMGSRVYLCYERCYVDTDCAPGFRCVSTSGGATGDAICLPG